MNTLIKQTLAAALVLPLALSPASAQTLDEVTAGMISEGASQAWVDCMVEGLGDDLVTIFTAESDDAIPADVAEKAVPIIEDCTAKHG